VRLLEEVLDAHGGADRCTMVSLRLSEIEVA
jgi:hypothetical protein